MAPVTILGLSAYYHDSAAALVQDGKIIAAASEERFTRKKGDAGFPSQAVAYCLRAGGVTIDQLSAVGFYDKPIRKFGRIVESYIGVAPRGLSQFLMAGPLWVKDKLWMDRNLRAELEDYEGDLLYAQHHESHAASAFFPSPFKEAAILTIDGVGEWATASYGVGRDADIQLLKELRYPDSLGLLYSAFTYYTGFKVNSGE
jgi:carbamoyltransferase